MKKEKDGKEEQRRAVSCEENWRRVGGINRWWEEGRRNRALFA